MLNIKREKFLSSIRKVNQEKIFNIKRQQLLTKEEIQFLLQQTDHDSINKLINISASTQEQITLLIELDGIDYFHKLLYTKQIDSGIYGLGNIFSDKQYLKLLKQLKLFNFMIEEVHKYQTNDQLTLRLWFLTKMSKIEYEDENYEEYEEMKLKLLSIFLIYQQKYPDSLNIQTECFQGIYFIVKTSSIDDDIMTLCCQNFNKGIDQLILGIIYHLLNDNIRSIQQLNNSNFIDNCYLHLQIKTRQKYTLGILYYYAQYYTEKIVQNQQLVEQIVFLQINNPNVTKQILILHCAMLFKCPRSLFNQLLEQFQIINYVRTMLYPLQHLQSVLTIIALLKTINKEYIKQLIPLLEQLQNEKNLPTTYENKLEMLLS